MSSSSSSNSPAEAHRGIKIALGVVSQVDHVALVYFNVDRYYWDVDTAHAADSQSFKYWTLIITVVYAISVGVMFLGWGARTWYCFSPRLCVWRQPPPGQMEWVDELGEWNSALALSIGPPSIIPYAFLLYWNFIGTYPREFLVALLALSLFSIVINGTLYFFYVEEDRLAMRTEYKKQVDPDDE